MNVLARLSLRHYTKPSGSSYLFAVGILSVLIIGALLFTKTTSHRRWQSVFATNQSKAEALAEMAAALIVDRTVVSQMNDMDYFCSKVIGGGNFFQNFYMMFRIPTVVADFSVEDVFAAKTAKHGWISANPDKDITLSLDPLSNTILKGLYKPIEFNYEFNGQSGRGDPELILLDPTLEQMGGKAKIRVSVKVSKAFGILPKNPDYEIGGVTCSLGSARGWLGKLIDGINTSSLNFSFNLTDLIPDKPIINISDFLQFRIYGIDVGFLLRPLIEPLVNSLNPFKNLTMRSLANYLFGNLNLSISFDDLKNEFKKRLFDEILPTELKFLSGIEAGWGVTIEKKGILEVNSSVEYQPYLNGGPTIRKTLVIEREFRVADVQPVAPEYTFFVANSAKLYEDPNLEGCDEKGNRWPGNTVIQWQQGDMSALICHNLPANPLDALKKLVMNAASVFSGSLIKINRNFELPGLIRVNGKHPHKPIKLSIMDPDGGISVDSLKMCEILALVTKHDDTKFPDEQLGGTERSKIACCNRHDSADTDGKTHPIKPGVNWSLSLLQAPTYTKGTFDWPYWGDEGFWLPFMIPMHSRNLLFGNYHMEFPFNFRVEGYLYKQYGHFKAFLFWLDFLQWLGIPPIPIFPCIWTFAHSEPYGFCMFPPWEKGENPAILWDADDPKNFPANLYSPEQYKKKASYFYRTSDDFFADVPNRTKTIRTSSGEVEAFVCDGVTYVNDALWFDGEKDFLVTGRGVIVAAGCIHICQNIRRVDSANATEPHTVFSMVSRCGAICGGLGNNTVEAALFADRGVIVPFGSTLRINGNLVVNRFERKDIQGKLEIQYQANRCRTSVLSFVRSLAKYDPTRYIVTLSKRNTRFSMLNK